VRRLAGTLAALLLIAPAGLRVATAAADADAEAALRCAIACGHAAKAGAAGAACCPMAGAGAAKGAAMASCPRGDSPAAAPMPSGHLAILASIPPLASPLRGSSASTLSSGTPRDALARPPDHVPILPS
jgi:hypothetical protein